MNKHQQLPDFPQAIKVVAFDCDGVLFDSKEANIRFYNHILERFGEHAIRPDQEEYAHMHPVFETLRYLLGNGQRYQNALDYSNTIDFKEFNACLKCEPGLVNVLEAAKSSFKTALATNRMGSTHKVLAHFNIKQYFDLIVTASDVVHPKPDPEEMDLIAKTFGVSFQQILYVGDSTVDAELAAATGVIFVAYKNPALQAHIHVSHFDELHPVLEALAQNGTR